MADPLRARRMADTQLVGRILVIADALEIVDVVTEYFADLGYEVRGVLPTEEALSLVHLQAPDVILLDVQMPRLGEVFEHLRARSATVPVIVATGSAQIAKQRRPLGAFAYVHKPFDWDELRSRVAIVIYSALRSRTGARSS